jgi:diguanylate cyclase (GGDEF)-like protein/putative nucleotidyltransferase with HDIG domain
VRSRSGELQQQLASARQRILELEEQLAARDLRDGLTGLHSAQAFASRARVEVERTSRHGCPLAIAALDVDGFHLVNQTYGRDVGDHVLKAVADVLVRNTRVSDVVCRPAADEFLVLLPETPAAATLQAFARILLTLESMRVGPVDGISASVGVAEWERPMTEHQLVAEAELRMRAARGAGGGRAEATSALAGSGRDIRKDAIAGLAEALLERDRYTGEHSEFVVDLSTKVARGLALNEIEVERVQAAALLHDIGKVAIPDEVLNKPGPLDELEWAVMREHPVIGERILRAIPGFGAVARIVRHEHERWDGKGYPDGLSGEAIPIGSRIILACDAYHAMTSDRPYRRAMPHQDAVRELGRSAGSQFDPAVTEVLIGVLYGSRQGTALGHVQPAPLERATPAESAEPPAAATGAAA